MTLLLEAARGLCCKRTLDEAKRSLGLETLRKGQGKEHKVYWARKGHTPPETPLERETEPSTAPGSDDPDDVG